MPKKNVKFIPTRPIETHRAETSRDTTPHCHPEAQSAVRVSGQVGTVVVSQGPHALQAQDDVSCFRHPEAHPHSRHPEERSDVRVLGQVGTVVVSRGPHALRAQDDEKRKKDSGRRASGEQGRSMVEMLGTLAIMGVLSIGGVAGYRYAVDKANANAILDGVNKRAVIVSQQRIVGQEVNLSEFEADIKGAYPTTAEIYADNRFFAVLVDKVPQGVCDHILREKTRFASDVFVSTGAGTGVDECPEGESMVEFTFANDFNAGEQLERCTTQYGCSACEKCQDGACVKSCPSGQDCAKIRRMMINWEYATPDFTCCPTERIVDGYCCPTITYDANGNKLCCADSNKTKCCPSGQFYASGQCYDCDDPTFVYEWGMANCKICPNRVLVGDKGCALKCPDPDQILWNGHCLCPYDKPLLSTADGKCLPCGSSGVVTPDTVSFIGVLDMLGKIEPDRWFNGCYAPMYCGGMICTGSGYASKMAEQEGYIPYYNVVLKPNIVRPTDGIVSCDDVQIDKLQFKSQCEACGGTWTGEWWQGTCTPPVE